MANENYRRGKSLDKFTEKKCAKVFFIVKKRRKIKRASQKINRG